MAAPQLNQLTPQLFQQFRRSGGSYSGLCLVCLFSTALASGVSHWPGCQEQGAAFRHLGEHGLFGDFIALGATEGCYANDCTNSDKFRSASAAVQWDLPESFGMRILDLRTCHEAQHAKAPHLSAHMPPFLRSRTCHLRKSSSGREAAAGFVSGSKACFSLEDDNVKPLPDVVRRNEVVRVTLPFAETSFWAASLPAAQPCFGGAGAPGCQPWPTMVVWRYATNCLLAALAGLPEEEMRHQEQAALHVKQLAIDIATFFQEPNTQTFQVAASNVHRVFDAFGDWLQQKPPTQVRLDSDVGAAPHLPTGRSATLPDTGAGGAVQAPSAVRIELSNGLTMPMIGFGTWQLLGQQAYDAVLSALDAGYRHIDTAQAYENEMEVGQAIKDSGVPREELFIATKASDPDEFAALEGRFMQQLRTMGLDYFDLYMLHTPEDPERRRAAWITLESLYDRGLVRSLGVSNFDVQALEELFAFARIRPVYIQNKFSVYSPGEQRVSGHSMLEYAQKQDMVVMGYSLLNPWPFLLSPMEDPLVKSIAARYGRPVVQVLNRWALQLGVSVIPKSASPQRIAENARVLDFRLAETDMRLLNGIVTLVESSLGNISPEWAEDVFSLRHVLQAEGEQEHAQ